MQQRSPREPILADLDERAVLLSGPRQCGKTTLSKMLYDDFDYFNYDVAGDRLRLQQGAWDRAKPLVIFDELHKMRRWKSWLKGIVDTDGGRPRLLVTGSARLDTYRKVGDSMAGRYFRHRLHPLDLREIGDALDPDEAFGRLMRFSGFPEPFLRAQDRFYKRWRQTHLDIILRQDLLELEAVRDILGIETLVELLRSRVGAPVSYASLARDLDRDAKTVKHWLALLENLYVVFRVTPRHRNVGRSLLKAPKFYFYDNAQVSSGDGPRLENLVACALRKELDRIEDEDGERVALHYLRTKDGREVDFLTMVDGKATCMLEVKWGDSTPSRSLRFFASYFPDAERIQLVHELDRETTFPDGLEIRRLIPWLTRVPLNA